MASNITENFKRKAGLSAGFTPRSDNFRVFGGPTEAAAAPAAPAPVPGQVESARPTLRQVAPGITETATPGVFSAEPVQNPGRTMPRPAMPEPAVNVGAGSPASIRQAFNNAYPQPQVGPAAPPAPPAPGMTRADILGTANAGPAAGGTRLPFDTSRSFTPIDNAAKSFGRAAGEMGQAVKDSRLTNNFITNNPLTRGAAGLVGGAAKLAGKVLPGLGAAYSGYDAVQEGMAGNIPGAINSGTDALAAGALYTPAAPVAGAYLGGKAAGSFINSAMSEQAKETLGGTINQGLRNLGIGGVDDTAILQNRAAEAARPAAVAKAVAAGNPEKFQQQYGAAAQRAADQLGVDPKLLLAQWGMETGWGRSVVPGTNNLGNIKDFTGGGVRATDNMTGSRDGYRKFTTPEEFADHYVGLMSRKYPGVQGAGSDPAKFAAGLKGYAEDPAYASKIAGAYKRLGGNSQNLSAAPATAQPTLAQGAQQAPAAQAPQGQVEILRGTRSSLTDPNSAQGAQDRLSEMMDKVRDPRTGHIDPAVAANVMKTFTEGEGLRGQTAIASENARATRESNRLERERQALQFGVTSAREQQAQNRINDADKQKRNQDAANSLQKRIEDRFTITDRKTGKPTFDANKAGAMRQYMDRALGSLAETGEAESFADLDASDTERLMAASELMAKVQAEATNWPIPWRPDFLTTSNPLDLVGLTRLPNGDAKTRKGDIIPARFIATEEGDYFGGKPTSTYDRLFGKESANSKLKSLKEGK